MAARLPLLPQMPQVPGTGGFRPPEMPGLDSTGQGMDESGGAFGDWGAGGGLAPEIPGLSTTGQGMDETGGGELAAPTRLTAGGSLTIPPTAMPLPPSAMGQPMQRDEGMDLAAPTRLTPSEPTTDPVATPAGAPAPAPAPTHYTLPGFDPVKLNDPTVVGPGKYSPAVKYFASQVQNLPPTTASLMTVAQNAAANGFPGAHVVGSDRIDFNDGNGPIDAITDVGGVGAGWWFQNGPDRLGPTTPAPTTPPPGGGGGVVGDWGPGGTVPGGEGGGLGTIIKNLLAPTPSGPSFPPGFGGPGDAGAFPSPNTQQVGQDPDSLLYTSALAGLINNGGTPYGSNVAATLADLIGGGGGNLPSAAAGPKIDALIKQFSGGGTVKPQIQSFLQSLFGGAVSPSGGGGQTGGVKPLAAAQTGGYKPYWDEAAGAWSTDPEAGSDDGGVVGDWAPGFNSSIDDLGAPGSDGAGPTRTGGSAFDSLLASGGESAPITKIMAQLDAILNGGDTIDPAAKRNRLIAARDSEAGAFQGQMADARGLLAERGGLSQPGVNQGTENSAIGRVSRDLAQPYANAVRDIETSDMDRASTNRMTALGIKQGALGTQTSALLQAMTGHDTEAQNHLTNILQSLGLAQENEATTNSNLLQATGLDVANSQHADDAIMQSLSLATGLSQSQAQNVLAATQAGTDRQVKLSQIALSTLAQNQDWTKFLAEYGLNHDMVMEQLQTGRISALVPLLQLLLTSGSIAAGGFV